MFFRGVKNLNLDTKGRIAMPQKYREYLSASCNGELIITIEKSRCLMIFALPEWEGREKQLMQAPSLDPQVQSLQRLYVGYATETTLDSQGRILIPASLRKFAGLDKQVVLVGQGHKFELWDEQQWLDNQAVWLDAVSGVDGSELPEALKNFSF